MQVSEDEHSGIFIVSEKTIQIFNDNRIFFTLDSKSARRGGWLKIGSKLHVKKNFTSEPYVTYNTPSSIFSMAAHSYSNSKFQIGLRLGRYCSIAHNVSTCGFMHPIQSVGTGLFTYSRKAHQVRMSMQDEGIKDLRAVKIPHKELPVIENDVWIGDNVWLANGITIGSGSVLAAHAVVTKDVPPYSIVGGNPARPIRLRFPQEIVDELMDIQWWKYSLKQLSQFKFEDGIQFVESYRRLGGESLPPWTPKLVNIWNELISIS